MSERKTQFANGEVYHLVIRAIDSIDLFRDDQDCLRMIHDLFEFNDIDPPPSTFRSSSCRSKNNATKPCFVALLQEKRERKLLVEILAFCLMPNHVHLLARQLRDNGISRFMQKFGGYALYYNKKYKRKGHLFQDKFKEVHIVNDGQLRTVFVYVHTNPVALIFPSWKDKGITNFKKATDFIENYRWSSYPDYLEKKNFPSITSREFFKTVMGDVEDRRRFVNDWLRFKKELADFDEVAIE